MASIRPCRISASPAIRCASATRRALMMSAGSSGSSRKAIRIFHGARGLIALDRECRIDQVDVGLGVGIPRSRARRRAPRRCVAARAWRPTREQSTHRGYASPWGTADRDRDPVTPAATRTPRRSNPAPPARTRGRNRPAEQRIQLQRLVVVLDGHRRPARQQEELRRLSYRSLLGAHADVGRNSRSASVKKPCSMYA